MIAVCPAPARLLWLYQQTAGSTWTVGYFDPTGSWHEDSTHPTSEHAAGRVHWLNGNHHDPEPAELLARAETEIIRLEQLADRLDASARHWKAVARQKARHARELQRRGLRR